MVATSDRRWELRRRRLRLAGALVFVAASGALLWWQFRPSERDRGLALAKQHRYAEAEPLLTRALERDPRDLSVVVALAAAHVKQSKLVADAEPHISRWCALEPDNAQPFQLRMDLWQRLQRHDRALQDGLRILELEPKNDAVRQEVVRLLLLAGRFDDARRECRRCLDARPGDPTLLHFLAEIEHAQGHVPQALAVLEPLLAQHPQCRPAQLLRAILVAEGETPEKAIPLLRQVIAADPDPDNQQKARYHLSQALARCGQNDEATKVLAELRRWQHGRRLLTDSQQQPDNLALQVEAAAALLELGMSAEGLQMLDDVLRRAPNLSAAHRVLADHFAKQGRNDLATEYRRRAGI